MAGVIGRSGRRPRNTQRLMLTFDSVADLTFNGAGILMKDDSIPLIDRVRVCLPLALKRIPDKAEVTQLSINVSEADARALLERAERNSLIYKELRARKAVEYSVDATSDNGENGGGGAKVTVTPHISRGDKNLDSLDDCKPK